MDWHLVLLHMTGKQLEPHTLYHANSTITEPFYILFSETSLPSMLLDVSQCETAEKASKLLPSTSIVVSSQISYKEFLGWRGNTDHTLSSTVLDLFHSCVGPSPLACHLDHFSFELYTIPSQKLYFSHRPYSPQCYNARDIQNKGAMMTITYQGLTFFSGISSFNPHRPPDEVPLSSPFYRMEK